MEISRFSPYLQCKFFSYCNNDNNMRYLPGRTESYRNDVVLPLGVTFDCPKSNRRRERAESSGTFISISGRF